MSTVSNATDSGVGYELAKQVLEATLANGGGTFDRFGTPVIGGGYALSLHPQWTRVVPLENFTETQVQMYFHDFASRDRYIGTWVHEGQVHFDVVTIVDDYDEAMHLAVMNNQKAIFDLSTFEEHFTDAWLHEYESYYDDDVDEYTEWQDYFGGDDWDHGQYDWDER